jgi:hypothetical protein
MFVISERLYAHPVNLARRNMMWTELVGWKLLEGKKEWYLHHIHVPHKKDTKGTIPSVSTV